MDIKNIERQIMQHKGLIAYLEEKSKPFPKMFERVINHRKKQIEKLEIQKQKYYENIKE